MRYDSERLKPKKDASDDILRSGSSFSRCRRAQLYDNAFVTLQLFPAAVAAQLKLPADQQMIEGAVLEAD